MGGRAGRGEAESWILHGAHDWSEARLEAALREALTSGGIAGAHIDVYGQEPYEGPLREVPNVLLTPHAGSYAQEARALMEQEAVSNLLARLLGNEA